MSSVKSLPKSDLILPCIHGDPSKPETLEAWTRRLLVVEMRSSFVAKAEEMDWGFKLSSSGRITHVLFADNFW